MAIARRPTASRDKAAIRNTDITDPEQQKRPSRSAEQVRIVIDVWVSTGEPARQNPEALGLIRELPAGPYLIHRLRCFN
jgi:hypothetical protein